MEIRPAKLEEIDDLRALMVASMAGIGPGFYTADQTESAARCLTVPDPDLIADGTLYVVEIDGQLAGLGGWSSRKKLFTGSKDQESLSVERLDPAYEPARIRAFFVHPSFARRGVARMLYAACDEGARAAGFQSLVLMATLPGVPLYRTLGFGNERPVSVGLSDGSMLPCVEMSRTLLA